MNFVITRSCCPALLTIVTSETLVATAKKLGVNLFHYLHDRIVGANCLPSLASLIQERATLMVLGISWEQAP